MWGQGRVLGAIDPYQAAPSAPDSVTGNENEWKIAVDYRANSDCNVTLCPREQYFISDFTDANVSWSFLKIIFVQLKHE